MKIKLLYIAVLSYFFLNTYSQNEQCGTMENVKLMLEKDPSLKLKIDKLENQTQVIIKKRGTGLSNYNPSKVVSNDKANKTQGVLSLCGYDNTLFTSISAPTTVGQKVSPSPNCTYGGEFVTVTNLVGGRTYRISLCGANNFDTQLTIYPQGGGSAAAYNDDWCGAQSEIYFTPIASGNYDLLVDEYGCINNNLCAVLEVELLNIPRPKITIPVVVHVIHYGEAIGTGRNISNAQILSQIAVLNADFRRLNSDIYSVPAAFRGTSVDPLIEFCLAQQDEFGNPTTGIKRYVSSTPQVTRNDMDLSIKPSTIWDRNKYLNLWTVDFGAPNASLLGYAQFPGDPYPGDTPFTDGVVIKYTAFGNTGNVAAPYDLGRTTTHEVGHWLDLKHIWGDDTDCSGSDLVSDTPNQEIASGGSPNFPFTDACAVNYPGIMFYNYMDYSNDETTSMFTYGQFARMDAALFGPRLSLQTSQGCSPSTIGIKEYYDNNVFSIYPNPTLGNITLKLNFKLQTDLIISVYSVLGEKVYESKQDLITDDNINIDLTGKSNGVYFVNISFNGKNAMKKVILNN